MSKRQKLHAALAAVLLVLLLAVFLLFRPNFPEVGNGEKVFTFQLPGGHLPGCAC